ncbi:MAG: hypothetical protein KGI27_09360 [Thaumarchaeota archaeon]|nr:hypothetical protein [Nitrososphaerota archaeon]
MELQPSGNWVINLEVYSSSGGQIQNTASSTTIPAGTSVTLKLSVPNYSGGSNVQCEGDWGSTGVVLDATNSPPSAFVETSAITPGPGFLTGVISEYTTGGTGVSLGTMHYNNPKLIDSGKVSQSTSTVNLNTYPGPGYTITQSGVQNIPYTFNSQTYTVSVDSSGQVSTS